MKNLAEIFKAMGDPVRLEMINLLLGKEMCVCDILAAFNLSQPNVSHHLKILKHVGLVNDKREGKWVYYSLNAEVIGLVQEILQEYADKSVVKQRIRTCADGEKCMGEQ